jgi:hypothetical protein
VADHQLQHLLVVLSNDIRKVSAADEHQALVGSFFGVIAHLEKTGQIGTGTWTLGQLLRNK